MVNDFAVNEFQVNQGRTYAAGAAAAAPAGSGTLRLLAHMIGTAWAAPAAVAALTVFPFEDSDFVIYVPPGQRLMVPLQDRSVMVPAEVIVEDRLMMVPSEDRTIVVPPEDVLEVEGEREMRP